MNTEDVAHAVIRDWNAADEADEIDYDQFDYGFDGPVVTGRDRTSWWLRTYADPRFLSVLTYLEYLDIADYVTYYIHEEEED